MSLSTWTVKSTNILLVEKNHNHNNKGPILFQMSSEKHETKKNIIRRTSNGKKEKIHELSDNSSKAIVMKNRKQMNNLLSPKSYRNTHLSYFFNKQASK